MNRRPKVLQVVTTGITFKNLLSPLVDRLLNEGYDVHLACADGPYTDYLVERGYTFYPVAVQRSIATPSNLKAIWELYRLIRREKYDIVHVHTPIASVAGRIAAKLAGVPVIIYTAHGFYFHERMPWYIRKPIVWIERLLRPMTDMLMTQSQEDALTAVKENICPPKKVRWIGNGVDVKRFSPAVQSKWTSPQLKETEQVVGFVGRMVTEKGILELLEAIKTIVTANPEVKLLMVGDTLDDDRDQAFKEILRRAIDTNGLSSRIVFTGFVENVAEVIRAMNVFVLPSHREGMPRTIIEAMACGKPVVATDIRGCREEVVHGVTGLLVPVNDPQALAEALIHILSNPEKAKAMGDQGLKRAQEFFDEDLVLDRQTEIYSQLMKRKLGLNETSNWSDDKARH